ncbi:MAG: SMI1/KNR4 family protein [Cetobacterium somerae]|uniref:SMI1/KNR4 family protein n=1 Tax=Cetobacterium TaxID=180162 RepID=UPI002FCB0FC7
MEWKFIKELKSKDSIKKFEDIIGMELPKDYIEFIEKYNGARPKLKLFKTITGKEHVIKTFLSFNITDIENIFSVNEWLKKDFNSEYFAIASDPAGNYIVYNKKFEIYFWNHEINKFELITKTFTDFINMLYEE